MALHYGAKICLVNQYEIDHKNGRYLDTYGIIGDTTPPSLGVWTYPDGDRGHGSGTWQIAKEDGSLDAVGAGYTPVSYGDTSSWSTSTR